MFRVAGVAGERRATLGDRQRVLRVVRDNPDEAVRPLDRRFEFLPEISVGTSRSSVLGSAAQVVSEPLARLADPGDGLLLDAAESSGLMSSAGGSRPAVRFDREDGCRRTGHTTATV